MLGAIPFSVSAVVTAADANAAALAAHSVPNKEEVHAQEQFLHDRLWENRAVIHLWERQDLSAEVKVVAQKTLNSYMSNYTKGDFVLHFPDMPSAAREKLMRVSAQFARG